MKKNWKRWVTIFFVTLFVFVPLLAFGQDNGGEDPSAGAEFVGLLFSSGLTMGFVQFLRRLGVVGFVPAFARPLIAAAIGFGAVYLSNLIGVTIDLSPIAGLFAAGGGSTLLFGIGKEWGLKSSGKGK